MSLGIEKLQRLVRGPREKEKRQACVGTGPFFSDYDLAERDLIKHYCQQRGIDSLFHFSSLNNLESIMRYGLSSRDKLDGAQIFYERTDENRRDNRTEMVSLSISFPNYRMFFKKKTEKPKWEWVVIEIDSSVLWLLGCDFFPNNAAKMNGILTDESTASIERLRSMFSDETGLGLTRRDLGIPDKFTTDPQAEVLVRGEVATSFFRSINLEKKNRLPLLMDQFGNSGIPFRVSPHLFGPRKDFEFWGDGPEKTGSHHVF